MPPVPQVGAAAGSTAASLPPAGAPSLTSGYTVPNMGGYMPMMYPVMDPQYYAAQTMPHMPSQTLTQDQQSFLDEYRRIINQSATNVVAPAPEYMSGLAGTPLQYNTQQLTQQYAAQVPQQYAGNPPGFTAPQMHPQVFAPQPGMYPPSSVQPGSYPSSTLQPGASTYPFQYM